MLTTSEIEVLNGLNLADQSNLALFFDKKVSVSQGPGPRTRPMVRPSLSGASIHALFVDNWLSTNKKGIYGEFKTDLAYKRDRD